MRLSQFYGLDQKYDKLTRVTFLGPFLIIYF